MVTLSRPGLGHSRGLSAPLPHPRTHTSESAAAEEVTWRALTNEARAEVAPPAGCGGHRSPRNLQAWCRQDQRGQPGLCGSEDTAGL